MDRRDFLGTIGTSTVAASLLANTEAQASTTPSQSAPQPNILFCIGDDISYPHMSAYGTDWVNTPAFDRVAEEGVLFENCYTPNAKCAPSRSCIVTGRNSWQLEEAANHWCYYPDKFVSYVEALNNHGYRVGHTGKGWGPGIVSEGRQLTGEPFEEITLEPPADSMSNNDYAANFAAFLDEQPDDEPFCFWYGTSEPHRDYEKGVGIEQGGKSLDDIDRVPEFWPDNETVRTDMLDYAFEVEWFDQHLGRILDTLEEQGELDNTIVVVTGDHGMPFPRVKGQAYDWANHVPLAIMWPDGVQNPGRTVTDFVSFIDFAPTFLELAGVPEGSTNMQPIEGDSLTDILYSPKEGRVNPDRDHVLIGKERHDVGRPDDNGYPIRGIATDEYLYLQNFKTYRWPSGPPETGYLNCDGSPTKSVVLDLCHDPDTEHYWELCFGKRPQEELFNLKEDRDCVNNLAEDPDHQETTDQLRRRLFAELEIQDDPRMTECGCIFDDYTYANDDDRHFYSRYMRGEDMDAGWVNPGDFDATCGEPS